MSRIAVDGDIKILVGCFIKKRRKEINMSRRDLAKKLGYQWPNFIGMLETGAAKFPVESWARYADALEVPRGKFLRLVLEEVFPDMLPYFRRDRKSGGSLCVDCELLS
jgi:transcriptional regulator with XRE-family HTH domain